MLLPPRVRAIRVEGVVAVPKLGAMLRVQFLGMFGINRAIHAGSGADRIRLVALAALFVLIGAFVVAYAYGMGASLVALGIGEAVPALAVVAGSLSGALVTFLKANGILFGARDFDLTASLPVPLWQVALSRLAAIYGMNLLWAFLLMAPMYAAALPTLGIGAGSWVAAVASVALAPLAPMAVAVAAAFGLAAVSSRLRHGRVMAGVLGVVAAAALVVAMMMLSGGMGADSAGPDSAGASASALSFGVGDSASSEERAALGQAAAALSGGACALWPPAAWAAAGIARADAGAFFLFAAVSLLMASGIVALLGRFLLPVNSLLAAGGSARRAAAPALRRQPVLRALVLKELRAVAGTPVWLMNAAIGPVLALIVGGACLVAGSDVAGLIASGVHLPGASPADLQPVIAPLIGALVPWVLAFCLAMAASSASALSLEGEARWIMQTIPQSPAVIMASKMLANVALAVPAGLTAGALAVAGLRLGALEAVTCLVVPAAVGLFVAALGAFLNGRMPRYDWTSEYEIVKRSAPVMIVLFCSMAMVVVGAAASVVVPSLLMPAPGGLLPALGAPSAVVQLLCSALMCLAALLLARQAMKTDLRD